MNWRSWISTHARELNPKSGISRMFVSRNEGGRGLASVESCVRAEENSLAWCI